jgi:hypothetical protein
MNNNIDFKELWVKQNIRPQDPDELFSKLKHYKKKGLRKLIIANVLLIATSVFIVFIWYQYQPQLITTKTGIILIILAMVIYLSVYNQLTPSFNKLKNEQSNNEYLQHLITIKNKQLFLQTKMLNVYFMMISFGVFLYMYEYTSIMPVFYAVLAYTITLAWIGFNWFYIRPRTIKKQQSKLEEIINEFKRINGQFEGE